MQGLPIAPEAYIGVLVRDWDLRSQTQCFLSRATNSTHAVWYSSAGSKPVARSVPSLTATEAEECLSLLKLKQIKCLSLR